MTRAPSITSSVLWNWSAFFLGLAVMFALTPVMLDALGRSRFGIWNLVIGFISSFELLELGIRTALVRTVAERHAADDMRGVNAACSSSLVFFSGVGLCIILAGQASAMHAQDIFKLDPADVAITRDIMSIYSLAQGLLFPFNAFSAYLIGRQRYDLSNGFILATTIIRAGLTLLALMHGYGLLAVTLIHVLANALSKLGMAAASRILAPDFSPSPLRFSAASFRKLARLGGGLLVINIALRAIDASWLTLAGMTLSMTDVAYLSVTMAFARYLGGFVESGIRVMIPYIGSLVGESAPADQTKRIARASQLSLTMTIIVAGIYASGVCLFGGPFLTLWLGGETARQATPLLPAVMAQALVSGVAACCLNIFMGLGVLGRLPVMHCLEAAVSIGLGVVFIRIWGLAGLPLATLAAMACVRIPSYVSVLHARLGGGFTRDMIARCLGLLAVFLSAWWLFRHWVTPLLPVSYPGVTAGAVCYGLTVMAASLLLIPGIATWGRGRLASLRGTFPGRPAVQAGDHAPGLLTDRADRQVKP